MNYAIYITRMDNPFATIFNQYHIQYAQCVRELTGLAKEHHAAPDLESRVGGVLRTFVSNLHATQSALFFDMVNCTPPLTKESVIPQRQEFNLPAIKPLESPFRDSTKRERLEPPNSQKINLKANTLDKYLKIESLNQTTVPEVNDKETEAKIDISFSCRDHIMQDYSQCCARVGSREYYVEMEQPEFLDNYPPDTYQSMDGYVIGDPCMRMVDNDLFDAGQVFCKRHSTGFEDIREPPSSHANVPEDDGLDIVFENDYSRLHDRDLPLSDFDIDLI